MSRTHKDKPYKVRSENYTKNPNGWSWMYQYNIAGAVPKKRREQDTEDHWMSTPSWWTRLTMNRPQRRQAHLWERTASRTDTESLEELDTPTCSKKPHKYYW